MSAGLGCYGAPWAASLVSECGWESFLLGPQSVLYSLVGHGGGIFDKWTTLAGLCLGIWAHVLAHGWFTCSLIHLHCLLCTLTATDNEALYR